MRTDDISALRRMRQQMSDATEQAENDLRAVLSTAEGRRFFRRLTSDESEAISLNLDPGFMAYREGGRNMRLRLADKAKRVAPTLYVTMMREYLATVETTLPEVETPSDE